MQVIIVNTSVTSDLSADADDGYLPYSGQNLWIEQEPTMIPTQAQAIATDTVDFALAATIASRISWKVILVFFLHCATMIVNTIV